MSRGVEPEAGPAPTLDDLLDALAAASVGNLAARVRVPEDAEPEHPYTQLAYAVDILLSDLEYRDAAHRAALDDLRTLNQTLEVRVRDRTRELALANQELESFSAMVAHDLRAPVRAVEHLSRVVVEDFGDRLGGEGRELVETMRKSSERMMHLIDDLLALSRAAKGDLRIERVDLSALARETWEEVRRREPSRIVEFAAQDGLWAMGDPRLLRVMLENLIGNAFKFTRRAQRPRIEVGAEEREGGRAFYVRDNGAGFDETKAQQLFGAFQRLHPPNEFEGTGMGLATVKRIVERHGGRVWAEGKPGRGATFWFALPDAPPSDR
ncbi:MAG TPA: ATP-binding protein [Candidatus Thermoplasmatota archaeon]|nr:ATP-binding protein [Candidatus Thermoplasmatota archaeon]